MDMALLEARVRAVNTANRVAMELQTKLVEYFRPMIGCKILKVDGSLLASVQKGMPELPNESMLFAYRHYSPYSLLWVVKTCEHVTGKEYVTYHEQYFYVGDLDRQVLKGVYDPLVLRTDYTTSEIVQKRAVHAEIIEKVRAIENSLCPFGLYDR